jgi:hypothetical protein
LSDSVLQSGDRRAVDRRRRPTPAFSRYTFIGRRRGARREGEDRNTYVDRYENWVVMSVVVIIGLCVLDALFTLLYLQRGGSEANPLMAVAIEIGVLPFLAIKCGLTTIGVLFLCLHKNFRWVKPLMIGVLSMYAALLGYHVYLTIVF